MAEFPLAQNEPQGYMALPSPNWSCDRSAHLRSLLPTNSTIQISSGGGITLPLSLGSWATDCAAIDVVSVHDYGTDGAAIALQMVAKAKETGKEIILGEWGIKGEGKAQAVKAFVRDLTEQGVSWLYWEVVAPGKGNSDFEVSPSCSLPSTSTRFDVNRNGRFFRFGRMNRHGPR